MVLHAAGIRQTVRITGIAKGGDEPVTTTTAGATGRGKGPGGDEKPVIRTGDRARLRLQFIRSPEFVKPGVRLITREGRTRLIGRVAAVGGHEPLQPPAV